MIEYRIGDLCEAREPFIVHGCNAQGKMRSGVAKAIREKWPGAYEIYKSHERVHGLRLGEIIPYQASTETCVINAITQDRFGYDGDRYMSYDAIVDAFGAIDTLMDVAGVNELAIPRIGAGLGGGDWKVVVSIIEAVMADHRKISVYDLS